MKNLIKSSAFALLIVAQSSFAICPEWTSKQVGVLDRSMIDEASGLAASLLQPGKFIWSNDSGGASALYATGLDGKLVKTVQLSNFSNEDYEAIATGPCPGNRAEACIYVGDVGDGMGWRSSFKIGIFKEADFWKSNTIKPLKTINFSYPGGAHNAESMEVSQDGQILIFTKTEGGAYVYLVDPSSGKIMLNNQVRLSQLIGPFRGKDARLTDVSFSPSQDKLLLLSYTDIIEIHTKAFFTINSSNWKRGVDFNLIKGPNLPQQETIAYTSEHSFIVSTETPEGNAPVIVSFSCKGF